MEARPPAYLSPSRLSTYDRCPKLFQERYVEKQPQPPHIERMFGTAVHKGLEAHFRGQDHELAFLIDWRQSTKECQAAGIFVAPGYTTRGLELIDMVRELGLQGEPERRITFFTPDISVPIIGYVDLWMDGKLIDFKTSAFGWKPGRQDKEIFQPAIYSQAYASELGVDHPSFEFIVLPARGGNMQRIDATRSARQIYEALERSREIFHLIEDGKFECRGSGCPQHREEVAA